MNGNRGHYAFAPLNNMKNKRSVQAATPAALAASGQKQEEPVRRSGMLSIAVTILLPVLFVFALLIDSVALRLIFIAVAAIAIAAMWVMNVFAREARSTLSIAYLALIVVIAVALALSRINPNPESQQNAVQPALSSNAGFNWAEPNNANPATVTATPTPEYHAEAMSTSAAQKQLENFLIQWQENDIPDMLQLCAPSWVSKQQSAEIALWNLMRNRYPTEYLVENVQGSEADTSRTITVKITFHNQGTGDVSVDRMHVLMFRVNDTWYVDPQSLNGTRVDEAAEQALAEQNSQRIQTTKAPVVVTPKPTGDDAVQVYYNPDGGRYYHKKQNCSSVSESYWPLTSLYYSDLETQKFLHLMQCPICNPPARRR